jgi:hypothetical protein
MKTFNNVHPIDNTFRGKYTPFYINDVDIGKYTQHAITHMEEDLNEYDLLLVHRVLKKALNRPPHIKKNLHLTSPLHMQYIEGNWYYYLRNRNDVIFKILADTRRRQLSISILSDYAERDIKIILSEDGATFVRDLLREIKENRHLLSFKKNTDLAGTEIYMENVFLKNHFASRALFMSGIFDNDELIEYCRNGRLYTWPGSDNLSDAHESAAADLYKDDAQKNLESVYMRSAVHYSILSLESLTNMVYHIMLRRPLRLLKLDERLDWELKLAMMPYLCHGFSHKKQIVLDDKESHESFKELRKYRNVLFHSKISETSYTIHTYEDKLQYPIDLDSPRENCFSTNTKT